MGTTRSRDLNYALYGLKAYMGEPAGRQTSASESAKPKLREPLNRSRHARGRRKLRTANRRMKS